MGHSSKLSNRRTSKVAKFNTNKTCLSVCLSVCLRPWLHARRARDVFVFAADKNICRKAASSTSYTMACYRPQISFTFWSPWHQFLEETFEMATCWRIHWKSTTRDYVIHLNLWSHSADQWQSLPVTTPILKSGLRSQSFGNKFQQNTFVRFCYCEFGFSSVSLELISQWKKAFLLCVRYSVASSNKLYIKDSFHISIITVDLWYYFHNRRPKICALSSQVCRSSSSLKISRSYKLCSERRMLQQRHLEQVSTQMAAFVSR